MAPEMPGGDVELGRDHLAGLAHLPVVRHPARVDRRAARAHRGAELVGERLDLLEVALRPPAAGDHHPRLGELGPRALHLLEVQEARPERRCLDADRDGREARRGVALFAAGGELGGADR